MDMTELPDHVDVLIVGAGISGISAGYYIQSRCPDKSYAIIEARNAMGGTWDLFRYPGIRSDSDLYTFGFSFRPWTDQHAFADGAKIKTYIEDTAREYGIDQHIYFSHRAATADFNGDTGNWTVKIRDGQGTRTVTCHILYMCSGYYDYGEGYRPDWPSLENYKGLLIHPQEWPEDLDYADKTILVIGSGATAITLIPALAKTARHVTMLQRSPTYIVEMPSKDGFATLTRRAFGARLSHSLTRWKNILRTIFYYNLARRFPDYVKKQVMKGAQTAIGPDYDVNTHLNPTYKPWDQRVCIDKDGEMFAALRDKRASIVTDHIDEFTPGGIKLRSGQTLDTDIIVTATGLNMELMGKMTVKVDGEPVDFPKTHMYKAMMISSVPNLIYSVGYTNASWTLKAELIARYTCRLIKAMDEKGARIIVPRVNSEIEDRPALDLEAGYIFRAVDQLPKQGTEHPWRVYQNYILDKFSLAWGKLNDGAMQFEKSAGDKPL